MILQIWKSRNERKVHCRRGVNDYRPAVIPAGVTDFKYNALPECVVQVYEKNFLIAELELGFNVPDKAKVNAKAKDGRGTCEWPQTQDDEPVQPVVGELHRDGQAVSRPVHVQVPSVDTGNARRGLTPNSGPEGGSGGVHSNNDEQDVLHDRLPQGVGTVPAPEQKS